MIDSISDWEVRRIRDARIRQAIREAEQDGFAARAQSDDVPHPSISGLLLLSSVLTAILRRLIPA
jgi:hypothetical protein